MAPLEGGEPYPEQEAKQVSAAELLEEFGEEALSDSVVPARCDEGCMVEPDGTCEHGGKSVLLEAGLI